MKKLLVAVGALPLTLVLGVAALAGATAPPAVSGPASAVALEEIPSELLAVYQDGAARCPGLPWQVLAGIGWVESRHGGGRADPATGEVRPHVIGPAIDGRPAFAAITDPKSPDGWAHALGPMQFLSTTWRRWATLAPGRPTGATASPHNAWDAIHTAAVLLCAGRSSVGEVEAAVFAYNRSEAYVDSVLAKAADYGLGAPATVVTGSGSASGAAVVATAMRAVGVPYIWGGASPASGFDCSGLVQWSYAQIGVALPRTTSEQIRVGAAVPIGELQPGDLVFSRGGRSGAVRDLGHVAIYAGGGRMIVAPRTGQVVSLRPLDPSRVQAVRRVVR